MSGIQTILEFDRHQPPLAIECEEINRGLVPCHPRVVLLPIRHYLATNEQQGLGRQGNSGAHPPLFQAVLEFPFRHVQRLAARRRAAYQRPIAALALRAPTNRSLGVYG